MIQKVEQQLQDLGFKLQTPPSSKDALIKLLMQGSTCLSELDQSLPKSLEDSMQSLIDALVNPELIDHPDRAVKLLVASCISEITRITAPDAPYDDEVFKDIFQLIVSTFSGLSDINGPLFEKRVVVLKNMAKYKSCVVMLDLECDDLIQEMFTTFFAVARNELPAKVMVSMQTIMEVVVEESEYVNEDLLLTLLSVLGRDKKDVDVAARNLATNVIKNCAAKLEPEIKRFLVSSMSGGSKSLKPEISYHGVLYEVYCCAPEILSGVVPYLTRELLSDECNIRLKSVALVGDLFALPESRATEAFKPVFSEFLERLTDRAVEVRMSVLEYVKKSLMEHPSRAAAQEITSALCDRLLDYDENVRKQVVYVVCDVACNSLTSVPLETMKLVSERLHDKSLLVKKYTMERLADVYRASCTNQSGGPVKNDEYDWIVGKFLRCFYDKDFRSDAVEPILSLSMFPNDYSVKDKVKSWVRIFSGLDKVEAKALEKILEQKQRLQLELQKYLSLKQLPQEGDGAEIHKKFISCFRVMSHYFIDPAKAEECFQILDQSKDSNIWKILTLLLDPNTSSDQARNLREDFIKILGEEHLLCEFLGTLSLKCSYIGFDKDHVKELLVEAGAQKPSGSNELILSCMTIHMLPANSRIFTSCNMPEDVSDEVFMRESKKAEDDLKELGTRIKHYEDNLNFLRGQKNQKEESILDMQVAIGKYHTASLSKRRNKDPSSMDTEKVESDTLMSEISDEEESMLKAWVADQPWAEDVIGTVSTLGKVDDTNLSRLLSEYLGLETMQAIVCKSYKRSRASEGCNKDGLEIKASPIVMFLDKLRPYAGEIIADDPQRRLDLLKPNMANGETPHGFIGFAVNMINIDEADLYYYASTTGYSLRDTLFYNLFSNLQVYRSRDDMLKAIPYIPNGAISLDGGIIKNSATFDLGHPRRDITVQFPVGSKRVELPESYFATENRLKEYTWEKNLVMEDLQREEALLAHAKANFETKKSEFVQITAARSSLASQFSRKCVN